MHARQFWKTVTMDGTDFLDRVLALLAAHEIRYCVIGGQAVNAYADPLVSLDLELIVAVEQIAEAEQFLREGFVVEHFEHSLNVSEPGSDVRIWLQTDPRYFAFVARSTMGDVLGLRLPVARIEDVLQGKIWAALDSARRPSWRQKDLADIARLLEIRPTLRPAIPPEILARLV